MTTPDDQPFELFLHPGRDKRVQGGHPWVYSNEVRMSAEAKALAPGTIVRVHRVDGKPVGVGTFNPHSLIAVRLLSRDAEARIDRAFLRQRLAYALALRTRLLDGVHYRWVHAEGDGLPGLVVDRYGDVLSVQVNSAGMERLWPDVLAALIELAEPRAVVMRGDSPARKLEGLAEKVDMAHGDLDGPVEVQENGIVYLADLRAGQKTGWFHDQRRNRAFVGGLCSGQRVLDVYSFTGGFALAAAVAGAAQVTAVERSELAVGLAREAAERNGVAPRCSFLQGEAFTELERLATEGEAFDVLVLDPPAFAKSKKDIPAARRGYRKLVRLAAPLVRPGGLMFVASCSHQVDAAGFHEEVSRGLSAAGRDGRVLRSFGAGPDHPVHPHLPESAYLKSLTLQLD